MNEFNNIDPKNIFRVWCKTKQEYTSSNNFVLRKGVFYFINNKEFTPVKEDNYIFQFYIGQKDCITNELLFVGDKLIVYNGKIGRDEVVEIVWNPNISQYGFYMNIMWCNFDGKVQTNGNGNQPYGWYKFTDTLKKKGKE